MLCKMHSGHCLLLLVSLCNGITIKDFINQEASNEGLSMLRDYLKPLSIWTTLGNQEFTWTFFAPIDAVFKSVPKRLLQKFPSETPSVQMEVNEIFQRHLIVQGNKLKTDNGAFDDKEYKAVARDAKIYARQYNGEYFINGARIVVRDIDLSNGVLHIIDGLFYEPVSPNTAHSWITDASHLQSSDEEVSTSIFRELLFSYEQLEGKSLVYILDDKFPSGQYLTVFAPSNAYMRKLDTQFMRELKNSKEKLENLIMSHIISGTDDIDSFEASSAIHVYNSGFLKYLAKSGEAGDNEIAAKKDKIVANVYNQQLYVSNGCATGVVTSPDITVTNGVLHIIHGMLGLLYFDLWKLIENENDLR
jgi:uncharacterized surface protein with fasciclin (FAS1) repeats